MSIDDYEQRMDDNKRRENIINDARLDAKAQRQSREDDRILTGQELQIKYTGNSDAGGLNDSSSASKESKSPPTAEEQLDEQSERLFVTLKNSTFLPKNITQEWGRKIKEIKKCSPSKALTILDKIFLEYRDARAKYKPQRNILDMAIYKEMQYDKEMDNIKRKLDLLNKTLKHKGAYLKKNPFHGFFGSIRDHLD